MTADAPKTRCVARSATPPGVQCRKRRSRGRIFCPQHAKIAESGVAVPVVPPGASE